jgi:hypothetical protein
MIAVLDLWGFKKCIQIARPVPRIDVPKLMALTIDNLFDPTETHIEKFEFILDWIDHDYDIAYYKYRGK